MLPRDVLVLGLRGGCGFQKTAQVTGGGTTGYVEQVDVGGSVDSADITSQAGPAMLDAELEKGCIAFAQLLFGRISQSCYLASLYPR